MKRKTILIVLAITVVILAASCRDAYSDAEEFNQLKNGIDKENYEVPDNG